MSLWLAMALTLLGSSLMNFGIVFMKKGVLELPADRRSLGVLRSYFISLKGWLGLGCNVVGATIYVSALTARAAPISVLQPLASFGLVVNALLAIFYLHERFVIKEWFGIGLLFIGVIVLGMSAEPAPAGQRLLVMPRLLTYLAIVAILAFAAAVLLMRARRQLMVEVLSGCLAGFLLGLGYLNTRTAALAWREERPAALALFAALVAVGLPGGFWILLRGYYVGRVLIVKSINFVMGQLVIGIGGIFFLSEGFPQDSFRFWERVASYALIFGGFVVFTSFREPIPSGPVQQQSVPGATS